MRLISHAPQAPYFGRVGSTVGNAWTGTSGGFTAVWQRAGPNNIDFLNVQFYNQGPTCYTTYAGLFTSSNGDGTCPSFPGTSLAEIASYGVPINLLIVGKPLLAGDASNGQVPATSLRDWLSRARTELGYSGGAFIWTWSATAARTWVTMVFPNGRRQ